MGDLKTRPVLCESLTSASPRCGTFLSLQKILLAQDLHLHLSLTHTRKQMPRLYPGAISYLFLGAITSSMVGVTLFEMFRTQSWMVPKFSDVIKHPPASYMWEMANHVFMPLWYCCLILNYLFLSWVCMLPLSRFSHLSSPLPND